MSRLFRITQRHYDLILKQCLKNLPKEAGGFVGGHDQFIQAVFPLFNQHLFNQTDTFSFTSEDVIRAHEFFKKHDLKYMGMYHTHPTGEAYPSDADIKSGQTCHVIISYQNPKNPIMAAYLVKKKKVIPVPLKVVSGKGYYAVDVRSGSKKKARKSHSPQQTPDEDLEDLGERIGNIISETPNKYKRIHPREDEDSSEFSAMV